MAYSSLSGLGTHLFDIWHLFNHKHKKKQVKGSVSYLVRTVINPNHSYVLAASYLLAVRLAASTAIPFNTHKIRKEKKKKHCKLNQALCSITLWKH